MEIGLKLKKNNNILNILGINNVIFASGLNRLNYGYKGKSIRLRRTDSAETDIELTRNSIDNANMLSFCDVNSGYVAIQYDQSNNSNATQTTASLQPIIVSSGVLNIGILSDNTDDNMTIADSSALRLNSNFTIVVLSYLNTIPGAGTFDNMLSKGIGGVDTGWAMFFGSGATTMRFKKDNQTTTSGTNLVAGVWQLWVFVNNGISQQWYVNGNTSGAATTYTYGADSGTSVVNIGTSPTNQCIDGYINSVIIFDRNLKQNEIRNLYNSLRKSYNF